MFSRLLQWLGWESDSTRSTKPVRSRRPSSATAHLFEKKPIQTEQKSHSADLDGDFNPYNTGKFDRSASWEKISKSQR
jgi:hypothetical protein